MADITELFGLQAPTGTTESSNQADSKDVHPEGEEDKGIGLVILGLAVGKISYLFQSLERLKQSLPIDGSYITTLLKMIGITYIGQFSSGICRDAGYSSTGAQIELFCRLSVMVLSMPVLLALLDTIQGFLA